MPYLPHRAIKDGEINTQLTNCTKFQSEQILIDSSHTN